MSTSATSWIVLMSVAAVIVLLGVIVYQTRPRARVFDFYENRKELNKETGGLQHELDTLREGWIMWPAGGTAVAIPAETLSHIERLILLNPDVSGPEYSRLFVGNEMNVKSTILDLTKRAQDAGVNVRWSTHSYLSIVINDHRSDLASARIEFLLPGIESAFRPSFIIKKLGNPRLFETLVKMYESVWKESKEATVPSAEGTIPSPAPATIPNAASMNQWAGKLEAVVTRGPRLQIRFNPDLEPYRFAESLYDTTHYRMVVYNDGPGTADNLQVWLTAIAPRPQSPLFRADFPYAVRWSQGTTKDNIGYRLNPRSEIQYEFLFWWISSSNQLMIDGVDTKHEPRDARFPMEDTEIWRMDYEITCASEEPQKVCFLVKRDGQKVIVSRVES